MTKKARLLILAFPLAALLAAMLFFFLDIPILRAVKNFHPLIQDFFQVVTRFGVSTWYLIGSALLFLFFYYIARNTARAYGMLFIFCAVALSGLTTRLIKWVAGRWRPKVFFQEGLYGFGFFGGTYGSTSFPSGHAATAFSLAFALSVLFPRWRWCWFSAALLIGVSRAIIGAHYLSDVVIGAYVGILIPFLLWTRPFFKRALPDKPAQADQCDQ